MNTVSSNSNSVPHSFTSLQITKYVEREIMNHRSLMHPHIVQFKEVSLSQVIAIDLLWLSSCSNRIASWCAKESW